MARRNFKSTREPSLKGVPVSQLGRRENAEKNGNSVPGNWANEAEQTLRGLDNVTAEHAKPFRNLEGEIEAAMDASAELVYLGFQKYRLDTENDLVEDGDPNQLRRTGVGPITWEQMKNVAGEPRHRFEVDGVEVGALLQRMASVGFVPTCLWHSHSGGAQPSLSDIQFFPAWLCERGAVFGAASGTTVLYNGDGVISAPNSTPGDLLAAQ